MTTVRIRPARRAKAQELGAHVPSLQDVSEVTVCGETVALVRTEPHVEVLWMAPEFAEGDEVLAELVSCARALVQIAV